MIVDKGVSFGIDDEGGLRIKKLAVLKPVEGEDGGEDRGKCKTKNKIKRIGRRGDSQRGWSDARKESVAWSRTKGSTGMNFWRASRRLVGRWPQRHCAGLVSTYSCAAFGACVVWYDWLTRGWTWPGPWASRPIANGCPSVHPPPKKASSSLGDRGQAQLGSRLAGTDLHQKRRLFSPVPLQHGLCAVVFFFFLLQEETQPSWALHYIRTSTSDWLVPGPHTGGKGGGRGMDMGGRANAIRVFGRLPCTAVQFSLV